MEVEVEVAGRTLRLYVDECTYPPLEDSLVGVKVLEEAAKRGFKFTRILDIGTGSGVLLLAALTLFNPPIAVGTDISPYAVKTASRNLQGRALVVRCNVDSCLRRGLFDLVMSNPPYLPVDDRGGRCEGYEALQWGSPQVLEEVCKSLSASRMAALIVYSTLTPIDFKKCLRHYGFEPIIEVSEAFFMERIIGVFAVRR